MKVNFSAGGRTAALAALWAMSLATAGAQSPAPVETPISTPTPEATPLATSAPIPEPTPGATPETTPVPVATPAAVAPATGGVIGGYGELHYTNVNGPAAGARVDLHRLVLRVSNRYSETLSFRSALSVEHGEFVDLEEIHLSYSPRPWLGVRGGLLLVPVGLLNSEHEPPAFHGVERNRVDTRLVPTTWREAGISVFGEPVGGLRYQVAFFNGLNAGGFSGDAGLRGGRSETARSASNDGAVAVRLEYVLPIAGLDAGGSYFEGGAGRQEIDESVSVRLLEADVRFQRRGVGVRAQVVRAWIHGAEALDDYLTTGIDPIAPVGAGLEGYYVEVAYDVLEIPGAMLPALGKLALVPFVRYEHTNTQLDMPGAYPAAGAFDQSIATAGLTFRPLPQIALKADYQWTWAGAGHPPNVWHLGAGYVF